MAALIEASEVLDGFEAVAFSTSSSNGDSSVFACLELASSNDCPNVPVKVGDVGTTLEKNAIAPPNTIHLHKEPAPYAQLCFSKNRQSLVTLLVGTKTKAPRQTAPSIGSRKNKNLGIQEHKFASFSDACPKIAAKIPKPKYVEPATAAAVLPAALSQDSWSPGDGELSSTGWSTGSSTTTDSGWTAASSPQNVIWLDQAWLYDESSEYTDLHRTLLYNGDGNSSIASSSDDSACSRLVRRTIELSKSATHPLLLCHQTETETPAVSLRRRHRRSTSQRTKLAATYGYRYSALPA